MFPALAAITPSSPRALFRASYPMAEQMESVSGFLWPMIIVLFSIVRKYITPAGFKEVQGEVLLSVFASYGKFGSKKHLVMIYYGIRELIQVGDYLVINTLPFSIGTDWF